MQTRIYRRLLLGLAVLVTLTAARPAHAQTPTYSETVLYNFCSQGGGSCTDGAQPVASVTQGTDGNFYGTTLAGGADNKGTVFKVTSAGTLTTLYSFCSLANCDDGDSPEAGLVQGTDGNFYGTTSDGGAYGQYGTVFKMTPAGALLTLYSFCSLQGCTDGEAPAGLARGKDGNFYGTTYGDGAGEADTVFKITPSGNLTTLYDFGDCGSQCPDGAAPSAGLVQGTDGNFYGVTASGGAKDAGTVFKITPTAAFSTLYSFCSLASCDDGESPIGALVQGTDGNLYGTTFVGGANDHGTVFRMTLSGAITTLYNFCSQSNCSDGADPGTGLVQGSDGNFYGTTQYGGAQGDGTVFQITPSGTFGSIYSFCSQGGTACTDGVAPGAALLQGTDGNFYGTTFAGGSHSEGVVFKLTSNANLNSSTVLAPAPNPASVGQTVTLTATVSGAQGTPKGSVTFSANGTSLGSSALNASGVAMFSVSTEGYALGTYSLLAVYSGSSVYKGSQSSAVSLVLIKAGSGTTLIATPNPAQVGQTITLAATVSGIDETPTGTVNFTVNGTSIGNEPLSSGIATLTASTNKLALGTYPVVATYAGNSDYNSSQSSALNVVLEKAVTTTTLTGAPNPVTPPASVTLIAAVQRTATSSKGVPTGTVTFYYGTESLGTVTLNESAEASITQSSKGFPAGTYPITVKYNGDADDSTSTSAPLNVVVN